MCLSIIFEYASNDLYSVGWLHWSLHFIRPLINKKSIYASSIRPFNRLRRFREDQQAYFDQRAKENKANEDKVGWHADAPLNPVLYRKAFERKKHLDCLL